MNIKKEVKDTRYKVVYVPHKVIKDYNACYNVKYKRKLIRPPVAKKLRIPLNEIWISAKWKKYEKLALWINS